MTGKTRKPLAQLIPPPCDINLATRCSGGLADINLDTECDCPRDKEKLRTCEACWMYLAQALGAGNRDQGACLECNGINPWEVTVRWDDGRRATLHFDPRRGVPA